MSPYFPSMLYEYSEEGLSYRTVVTQSDYDCESRKKGYCMADKLITFLLLIVAVIHIISISGFAGVSRLEALYGLPVAGADMEILMRHRAALFGILGIFFAYAAFTPSLQPLAFIAAFATIASFFYLAFSVGEYNAAIGKIVIDDVVAAISLVGAVILFYTKSSN